MPASRNACFLALTSFSIEVFAFLAFVLTVLAALSTPSFTVCAAPLTPSATENPRSATPSIIFPILESLDINCSPFSVTFSCIDLARPFCPNNTKPFPTIEVTFTALRAIFAFILVILFFAFVTAPVTILLLSALLFSHFSFAVSLIPAAPPKAISLSISEKSI